jgi:hypothetical protein
MVLRAKLLSFASETCNQLTIYKRGGVYEVSHGYHDGIARRFHVLFFSARPLALLMHLDSS